MTYEHCDCIKTEGGIRGFGAWCHAHKKLLDEYEFHKARDEELFRRYRALEESSRASYVTLECQYARLMDQYMELKGQIAKLELIQKNSEMAETAYRNRVQAVLASPSEAKGDTPDEPTTCLGIIKYGICSCGQHRGDIP